MSIPAGYLIKKLGYKGGIVLGLTLMGFGCLTFYPASIIQDRYHRIVKDANKKGKNCKNCFLRVELA